MAKDLAAVDNLSRKELRSIAILGLILACKQQGDTDYSNNHAQLKIDANAFWNQFGMMDWEKVRAVICWQLGKSADASLSTDVNSLLANTTANIYNVRAMPALSEELLEQMFWLLMYDLAVGFF